MTPSMGGPGRLIASRLDPILRPVGFSIGSLNPDSVLFCGPPETAARFPWIAESYGDQNVTCVDVMIEATDADGTTRADFEVSSLEVLLDVLGETELATSVRDRHRLAFADQLELIAAAVEVIFGIGA